MWKPPTLHLALRLLTLRFLLRYPICFARGRSARPYVAIERHMDRVMLQRQKQSEDALATLLTRYCRQHPQDRHLSIRGSHLGDVFLFETPERGEICELYLGLPPRDS
jgi:hypothetical protein